MRHITLILFFFGLCTVGYTQSVGIGTTNPDSSAILDLSSNTQGFLMPRMTTAQRDAIVDPADGLQILNLDDKCIDIFIDQVWRKNCKHLFDTDSLLNIFKKEFDFAGTARDGASAFTINGVAYVSPGYRVGDENALWAFDGTTWTQKAFNSYVNFSGMVGFSTGGFGYLVGGIYNNNEPNNYVSRYDPSIDTWTNLPDFPIGISDGVTFTINDTVYVGTGRLGMTTGNTNAFYKFNPSNNTWTSISPLPGGGRRNAIAFSLAGYGYVGTGHGAVPKSDFYKYNPSTNSWTQVSDFVDARSSAVAFSWKGKGYVGTGLTGQYKNDFYKYDPNLDSWEFVGYMDTIGRYEACAFVLNEIPYILTGYGGGQRLKSMFSLRKKQQTFINGSDISILSPGRLSIGTTVHNGYLQIANTADNRKIILNEVVNDNTQYDGFGTNTNELRYNVASTASSHNFYANTSNIFTIKGNGKIGINGVSPNGLLQFPNTADNRKIVLNEVVNDNTQYDGFGTNTNELRYNVASTASSHNFYANTSNIFTIKGDGKIGINGVSPNGLLQFPNFEENRKIVLNEVVNDNAQYDGFGTNTNELRYNVASTALSHNFYAIATKRFSIVGPAVSFDPDQNAGTIGIGQIADGGIWSVGLGIGGNNGNTWGIGSGGGSLYIGLGNGVTSNSIQTAIEFNKNRNIHLVPISGKVGLGMTAPNGELQFANTMNNRKIVLWEVANNDHQFYGIGIESGTLRYQVAGGGNVHRFYAGTSATTSNLLMTIFDDGNVTIAGALTQNSDATLKKNILPISSSISSILALQGYHYQWKDGFKDQNLQSGFLAQEVEKIYPHLVSKDEKGLRSVNYIGLMPYMVEEMKVQQRKYTALSEEHDLLKNKYTDLEQRLKILEDKLRE